MRFEDWISAKSPEEAEEFRRRFKMAINNSIRRKILKQLLESAKSVQELKEVLSIDEKMLRYHIDILKKGECVDERDAILTLTEEGKILANLVREKE